MTAIIPVQSLGSLALWADQKMEPFMRWACLSEPGAQRTHRWNNHRLTVTQKESLDQAMMVHNDGIPAASPWRPLLFHLPRFGGWKDYVVIRPIWENISWHIGWATDLVSGISRIELRGPVRVLVGPDATHHFGVEHGTGEQIPLEQIGSGIVGETPEYRHILLL